MKQFIIIYTAMVVLAAALIYTLWGSVAACMFRAWW